MKTTRTTKTLTFSLPPEMVKEINRLTKEERRNRSELIREAFRTYIERREWEALYRYGERRAREAQQQERKKREPKGGGGKDW